MSVKLIGKILDKAQADHGPLLVLIVLANYADDEGQSFPSIATIAKKSRLSERNVYYVLNELQKKGFIAIHKDQGPRGSHLYQILPACYGEKEPEKQDENPPKEEEKVVHEIAGTTCNPMHNNLQSHVPPYREPSGEQSLTLPGMEKPEAEKKQPPKSDPKSEPKKTSEFNLFKQLWCTRYTEVFGKKYPFFGGADASAIKALMGVTTAEEAIKVAEKSWQYYRAGEFGYELSMTIKGFNSKFGIYSVQAAEGIPKRQAQFVNGHSQRREVSEAEHRKGFFHNTSVDPNREAK